MTDRSTARQPESSRFWEGIYGRGGNSGTGSYGRLAAFKADVMNRIIAEHHIQSVVELGCGDGKQISRIDYPDYLGLDTSSTAVDLCRARFVSDPTREFRAYMSGDEITERAELSLSLDVVYHLLEDTTFDQYMRDLFTIATRLVVVYSSDMEDEAEWPEVRHRTFTKWVGEQAPDWRLRERIPNQYPYVHGELDTSWADFFIFERQRP